MKYLKFWFPVLIYCCIIFGVSSVPGTGLPATIPNLDKCVHFLEYAFLGVLIARALESDRELSSLFWVGVLAALLTSLYGITDEWHQAFVVGRTADMDDWIADSLGGATGAAMYLFWRSKYHRNATRG